MAQYSFASLRGEYDRLFSQMRVTKVAAASSQARRIIAHKDRYQAVERTTGVPWFVVGCLHMRESDANFGTWLHNGDPMRRGGRPARTVNVPRGRPPDPGVSWEEGAHDALVVCEHLDQIHDWSAAHVAYAMEKFNGWGYRSPSRNIPSPYLWGGTNIQRPGKFVRDGVYDPNVMDSQIGGMAVLKQIMELDPSATFAPARPAPLPEPIETRAPAPPPASPKAEDTVDVAPPVRSRTWWGNVLQYLTTAGASLLGYLQGIPWQVIVALLIVGLIGFILVAKGWISLRDLTKHLAPDTGEAS